MKGISLGVFTFVAIVMSITYFSAGIIYNEADALGTDGRLYSDSTIATFEQWINLQWKFAYMEVYQDAIITGSAYAGSVQVAHVTRDVYTTNSILQSNRVSMWTNTKGTPIFDVFNNGMDWYDNYVPLKNRVSPIIIFTNTVQETIKAHYNSYSEDYGVIVPEATRGLIETALSFLGALPEAVANLVRLLTFTVPHMPVAVSNILRVIFAPLWIIFLVNLAIIVSDFLKGIGAITPFT